MVIGNYINDSNFWDIFTDLDIKVIASDLCISSRYFDFQVDLNKINGIRTIIKISKSWSLAGFEDNANNPRQYF